MFLSDQNFLRVRMNLSFCRSRKGMFCLSVIIVSTVEVIITNQDHSWYCAFGSSLCSYASEQGKNLPRDSACDLWWLAYA